MCGSNENKNVEERLRLELCSTPAAAVAPAAWPQQSTLKQFSLGAT